MDRIGVCPPVYYTIKVKLTWL